MSVHSPEGGLIPTELVERLEVAEAGSRELDAQVWYALFEPDVERVAIEVERHQGHDREVVHCELGSKWADECRPPVDRFTASLDAAMALAERAVGEACALDLLRDVLELYEADGVSIKTLPVTLCIAILKATTASSVGTEPEGRSEPNTPGEGEGL